MKDHHNTANEIKWNPYAQELKVLQMSRILREIRCSIIEFGFRNSRSSIAEARFSFNSISVSSLL